MGYTSRFMLTIQHIYVNFFKYLCMCFFDICVIFLSHSFSRPRTGAALRFFLFSRPRPFRGRGRPGYLMTALKNRASGMRALAAASSSAVTESVVVSFARIVKDFTLTSTASAKSTEDAQER